MTMMRMITMIKMMTYLCFLFFYLINLFLILHFGLGKVEDKDDGGKEDGKEPAGGSGANQVNQVNHLIQMFQVNQVDYVIYVGQVGQVNQVDLVSQVNKDDHLCQVKQNEEGNDVPADVLECDPLCHLPSQPLHQHVQGEVAHLSPILSYQLQMYDWRGEG